MSSGSGEDAEGPGPKAAADDQGTRPAGDRGTCTPCRGSGQVVSNLHGEVHQVTCPWCGGSGRFAPGRDAQEQPAEQG